MALAKISEIINDVKAGKFIILVDDEDRENEGDMIIAAEKITPEGINFMAKNARGLICMPIIEERLRVLNIPMMVDENTAVHGTAFTVSVDAKIRGVTTTGRKPSRRLLTRQPGRKTSADPDTSFRYWPVKVGYWSEPDIPKPQSTWPVWQGSIPPEFCVKL